MPAVADRAHSSRGSANLTAAHRVLEVAAMRLFDSLWEPLAVTVLGIVLFAASL